MKYWYRLEKVYKELKSILNDYEDDDDEREDNSDYETICELLDDSIVNLNRSMDSLEN